MFYELGEVQKVEQSITHLSGLKQKLDIKCLEAFSSNPNTIQNSLLKILQTVLAESQRALSTLKDIEDQVQMGYFIPSDLNLDELLYDSTQLPEWFQFVFKKQYEKQKKNLDGLCKKTYKMQSLPDVKHNLEKQIQSFSLLIDRYRALGVKQKSSLNIMGQAEIIKVKCKNCKEKYNNFCKAISMKILNFVEQSVSKSLNFSNSMNVIGSNVTNSFNVKLQPEQFDRNYLTNKFKQTAPTFNTDKYLRPKTNKSVDFHGRTMYNRIGTDYGRQNNDFHRTNNDFHRTSNQFSRTNNDFSRLTGQLNSHSNNDFSRLTGQLNSGNEYNRYVPRHINTTAYDFYN